MDWSNERYVRLYVRNTDDWIVWPWQARALLPLMMRAADRAGLIETSRGELGIAALTLMPIEVVRTALEALTDGDGAPVQVLERGYLLRNFIDAQEAASSDAFRKRESRAGRRDKAKSQVVTTGHEWSQPVTACPETTEPVTFRDRTSGFVPQPSQTVTDSHSEPSRAEPSLSDPVRTVAQDYARQHLGIAQRLGRIATALWLEHCDRYDAVKPAGAPGLNRLDTALGCSNLRDRLRTYGAELDKAESDCRHVLAVLEAEARANIAKGGKDPMQWFGERAWSAGTFSGALSKSAPKSSRAWSRDAAPAQPDAAFIREGEL